METNMLADKSCVVRGCACYDDRTSAPPVEIIEKFGRTPVAYIDPYGVLVWAIPQGTALPYTPLYL